MDSEWVLRQRERQLALALGSPGLSAGQTATLRKLDRDWKLRGLSVASRLRYARSGVQLARFLGRPFERATRTDLEDFIADTAARCSTTTTSNAKIFVKLFYKALLSPESDDYPELVRWIRLGRSEQARKLPADMLTPTEVLRMARATTGPRERAIIMTLYESAARASELLSLRIGDIEFDSYGARLLLRGKTGERKVRLVHSVPDLREWINCHPFRDDAAQPLFLSWGSRTRFKTLMHDGLWGIVRRAASLAGLPKPVHPHLFRHSRLTELAKSLSDSKLRVFAGWKGGSKMPEIYVHLSGEDLDEQLLETFGIKKTESPSEANPLGAQTCFRCRRENSAAAKYCETCSSPLGEKELRQMADTQDKLVRNLPALMRILEDPRFKELLSEAGSY